MCVYVLLAQRSGRCEANLESREMKHYGQMWTWMAFNDKMSCPFPRKKKLTFFSSSPLWPRGSLFVKTVGFTQTGEWFGVSRRARNVSGFKLKWFHSRVLMHLTRPLNEWKLMWSLRCEYTVSQPGTRVLKCSRPCLCNGVANTGRGHSCSIIRIRERARP